MKLDKELKSFLKGLDMEQKKSLIIGVFMQSELTEEDKLVLEYVKNVKLDKKTESKLWDIVSRSDNGSILSLSCHFLH